MLFRCAILTAVSCGLVFGVIGNTQAQERTLQQEMTPPPAPRPTPNPILAPPAQLPQISREQRQQAYAKLLEGQRHLWTLQNIRTQGTAATNSRLARAALQKAVELNPGLAEGYTALAELSFYTQNNPAEVERLANISVNLDRNNFGSRQLLARIYTRQSGIYNESTDKDKADKAIGQWNEIARLDPRNAEAWAFLSDLYDQTGQTDKQILALERWSGASNPTDDRFYRFVTQKDTLAPSAANAQLGRALVKAGKYSEAIKILTRALSVNDGDENAFSALEEALKNAAPQDAALALEVLRQAYNVNPSNTALLELLTDTQIRAGRLDEAAKMLKASAAKMADGDKATAANVLARLGSIYADAGRDAEAITAYEDSLKVLDIGTTPLVTEIERAHAGQILPRMVAVYRNSGQTARAKETINRLTTLLGKSDSSADEQLIELLRSTGDREGALQAVRDARKRFPEDQSLTVLEANVLTEMGKVDEGVELLRSKVVNKPKQISVPSALRDDFFAYITISNLFTQAGRGADAVASAQLAVDLSVTPQMTTIATVSLATAQNAAGDFKSAENSLREVLKTEPNNATALNNLGYFLTERGERLPEAIEMIKKAVEREPNNASYLDSLGWAYFKQNQLAEAEKYLTEAARRNPNSAAIQNHLGDLYQKQGKTEQAKTAWRKALNLTKQPTEIEKIRRKLGGK